MDTGCFICSLPIVADKSEVDDSLHSACWEAHLNQKRGPPTCSVCKKDILIVYKEHPGLHSRCFLSWKTQHGQQAPPDPIPGSVDSETLLQNLRKARKDHLERIAIQERFRSMMTNPDSELPSDQPLSEINQDGEMEISRILQHQDDYYQVLCVPRQNFDEVLLRTNYKKIALFVHPDKNQHESAEQCFKIVSSAFTCLVDPQLKASYDKSGTAGLDPLSQQRAQEFSAQMRALLILELSQSLSNLFAGSSIFNIFNGSK